MENHRRPPSKSGKPNKQPAAAVLNQPPITSKDRSGLFGAIVLASIAGVLLWANVGRKMTSSPPDPRIATLAVVEVPSTRFSEELPSAANSAMMSLVRGDCQSAAAQFRTARRGMPEVSRLGVMEGAAFLCAGSSDEARNILEQLAADEAPPRQVWWYLAQVCLLQADADCAQISLNQSILVDRQHHQQAEQQLRQLQSIQARR